MSRLHTPKNPRSLKTRLTYRFVRALKDLKKNNRCNSKQDIFRRSHRVKVAAYASMASAIGSKRAWSRAILWKIRNRPRNRSLIKDKKIISSIHALRRTKVIKGGGKGNPNPKKEELKTFGSDLEVKLRKLVPGGETMDACSLLDETADYIKCLATQVEVMRNILNFYST